MRILEQHSFRDPQRCLKLLQEFVHGPGFGHVSKRTEQNALQLLSSFLHLCKRSDAKLRCLNLFCPTPTGSSPGWTATWAQYGARSMLFEAWTANPSLFRLLLLAFDRSEFLAELAIPRS
jgi:glutamine synthetase adenylyltransferase